MAVTTLSVNVAKIIRASLESTAEQRAIIAALTPFNGKPFTKRTLAKVIEATGDMSIRMTTRGGYRVLEWGDYGLTNGRDGGRLLFPGTDGPLRVDTQALIDRNPAYFNAADERNRKREALLQDPFALETLQATVDDYVRAKAALSGRVAFGEDAVVVRHEILAAVGLG